MRCLSGKGALAEQPQVTQRRDGRAIDQLGGLVVLVRPFPDCHGPLDLEIDLAHREADRVELEVEIGEAEIAQHFAEELLIPLRAVREAVAAICVGFGSRYAPSYWKHRCLDAKDPAFWLPIMRRFGPVRTG